MKKLLIAILIIFPSFVFAAGIEVSPAKLEIEGINRDAIFKVVNPTAEVLIYEAYPEEFEEQILIEPKTFTLQAGETKTVRVYLERRNLNSNKLATNIAIVGKPLLNQELSTGTGVRLPLQITPNNEYKSTPPYPLILFGVGLIVIIVVFRLRMKT